ncbi:MAG: hypothetical protein ACU0BS_01155 [Hasllibacter sp.]
MDPATWPPEAQLLAVEAAVVLVGYAAILPSLRDKALRPVLLASAGMTAAAAVTAALLFWGTGARFTLILVEVNWLIFLILTYPVLEAPFALRFLRRHGIDLSGG